MNYIEATTIIVKTAIENGIIETKPHYLGNDDNKRIEITKFNADRVADFIKTVYDSFDALINR